MRKLKYSSVKFKHKTYQSYSVERYSNLGEFLTTIFFRHTLSIIILPLILTLLTWVTLDFNPPLYRVMLIVDLSRSPHISRFTSSSDQANLDSNIIVTMTPVQDYKSVEQSLYEILPRKENWTIRASPNTPIILISKDVPEPKSSIELNKLKVYGKDYNRLIQNLLNTVDSYTPGMNGWIRTLPPEKLPKVAFHYVIPSAYFIYCSVYLSLLAATEQKSDICYSIFGLQRSFAIPIIGQFPVYADSPKDFLDHEISRLSLNLNPSLSVIILNMGLCNSAEEVFLTQIRRYHEYVHPHIINDPNQLDRNLIVNSKHSLLILSELGSTRFSQIFLTRRIISQLSKYIDPYLVVFSKSQIKPNPIFSK